MSEAEKPKRKRRLFQWQLSTWFTVIIFAGMLLCFNFTPNQVGFFRFWRSGPTSSNPYVTIGWPFYIFPTRLESEYGPNAYSYLSSYDYESILMNFFFDWEVLSAVAAGMERLFRNREDSKT
jgi:hypothetical protein